MFKFGISAFTKGALSDDRFLYFRTNARVDKLILCCPFDFYLFIMKAMFSLRVILEIVYYVINYIYIYLYIINYIYSATLTGGVWSFGCNGDDDKRSSKLNHFIKYSMLLSVFSANVSDSLALKLISFRSLAVLRLVLISNYLFFEYVPSIDSKY